MTYRVPHVPFPVAGRRTRDGPAAAGGLGDRRDRDGCRVRGFGDPVRRVPGLPGNNWWNRDVSRLPVSRYSGTWLSHMSTGRLLHPDFGGPYGIPVTVVRSTHAKVAPRFTYADESDHVGYPLGADTRIEGGRNSGGDRHAIVVDRDTCRLYETWDTRQSGSRWTAGSGATWSLRSNALRPDSWTSADAAGLPILPGLLHWDEVHAGRVTTPSASRQT